ARWRMQRLRMIETALIDSEMQRELPETETPADPGFQIAFAFRRLVDDSRAISLASRYESRLHRIHERTHRTLRELQQTRLTSTTHSPSVSAGAPEPTPAPNQPELTPPTVAVPEEAPPSDDKNLRNEPTPPAPAAARRNRKHLSIVRHPSLRRIDIKKFRCFRQFK